MKGLLSNVLHVVTLEMEKVVILMHWQIWSIFYLKCLRFICILKGQFTNFTCWF